MKRTALLALILPLSLTLQAKEGMWLPTVLASIEDDMQAMGLQLTAEDIYSVNQGSLKDAIVLFGGGCTAEVISKEGLILTNHHCGFGAIQSHSSLEHDHLKNGFWAGDRAAELMNEGLTATFVVRMEDVTSRMMEAIAGASDEAARESALAEVAEKLVAEATAEGHLNAVIRAFNYGNSYLLIVTETYRDVRLVGAPPSGIGKFGGDTDNWMWPRHTGDFSLFRIYAGPDNLPADPAPTNVPFRPRHSLPIALDGVKEGDFAMIFGFPGRTQRYLSSYEVRHIMERQDPLRIRMRKASLAVIDQAMRSDDRTRIQYAAKQSRISNAYKKWIGELRGLKELDALDQKRALEQEYQRRADSAGVDRFQGVLHDLEGIQQEVAPYSDARDLFVEFVYYGPEVLRFAERFRQVAEDWEQLEEDGKLDAELEKLRKGAQAHFKDYDRDVDRRVFKALLPLFREAIAPELAPEFLSTVQSRFK
ncbi:MAG: S46 family peptidase, partial [Flavobacteriales bacterium]